MEKDRSEMNDLAAKHPKKVQDWLLDGMLTQNVPMFCLSARGMARACRSSLAKKAWASD